MSAFHWSLFRECTRNQTRDTPTTGGWSPPIRAAPKANTALHTVTTGYGPDDEIRTWEGRGATATSLGIVELTANTGFAPGNVNNASTFDFPVRYEPLGEIDARWVVSAEPHPEVIKRCVAAAQNLQRGLGDRDERLADRRHIGDRCRDRLGRAARTVRRNLSCRRSQVAHRGGGDRVGHDHLGVRARSRRARVVAIVTQMDGQDCADRKR
jgi:hypothetical protein